MSLASFLAGDHKRALLMAQKAVHCYPHIAEGWAVLISALLISDRSSRLCATEKFVEHFVHVLNETDHNNNKMSEWIGTVKSQLIK